MCTHTEHGSGPGGALTRAAPRWARGVAAPALLTALAAAAWANSLSAPFIFDDRPAILGNPHIRQLWPLSRALSAPPRSILGGRPVPGLTLAINYALGELDVRGYHAFNLALHVLSALILLGIVRRTLARSARLVSAARPLALVAAAIWLVHPLQTDAVTYVTQRTELLMGLFYLLTLYAAIRAAEGSRSWPWQTASVVSCALGMASKEVMITAPLMVMLYDRVFLYPSLAEARRRRWPLYAGLMTTWAVLATLLMLSPPHHLLVLIPGGHASVLERGMTPWEYLRTQVGVIARYLGLALWPHPLCLDHGLWVARTAGEVLPGGLVVAGLVGGTAWALRRHPGTGFLGAWFLVVLAPTSSVVPVVTEVMAERRMHLPLAAVAVAAVLGGYAAVGALVRSDSRRAALRVSLALAVIATLTALTARRNVDYGSEVSIWSDAAEKRPWNPRAHNNLGNALLRAGDLDGAFAQYAEAIRLEPDYAEAHYNLGNAFLRKGRPTDAAASYAAALRIDPELAPAHYNLGNVQLAEGRFEEAIAHFGEVLRIDPDFEYARTNLRVARERLAAAGQR